MCSSSFLHGCQKLCDRLLQEMVHADMRSAYRRRDPTSKKLRIYERGCSGYHKSTGHLNVLDVNLTLGWLFPTASLRVVMAPTCWTRFGIAPKIPSGYGRASVFNTSVKAGAAATHDPRRKSRGRHMTIPVSVKRRDTRTVPSRLETRQSVLQGISLGQAPRRADKATRRPVLQRRSGSSRDRRAPSA